MGDAASEDCGEAAGFWVKHHTFLFEKAFAQLVSCSLSEVDEVLKETIDRV